jgi:hypothetical protein
LDEAIPFPRFGDVAHLGHIELFTPKFGQRLAFFHHYVSRGTPPVPVLESGRE